MFTPYGYHGLGDSARIPISFTKEISNINWTKYAQLDNIKSIEDNDIYLTRFKIVNNTLCGNLDSDFFSYQNDYFVYDIDSEKLEEFQTETDYNKFAESKKLPKSHELKSFEENYNEYWSGWRFFCYHNLKINFKNHYNDTTNFISYGGFNWSLLCS